MRPRIYYHVRHEMVFTYMGVWLPFGPFGRRIMVVGIKGTLQFNFFGDVIPSPGILPYMMYLVHKIIKCMNTTL